MAGNTNRLGCFAAVFLLLSIAHCFSQDNQTRFAEARIIGLVVDEQGRPLKNIFVHAFLEQKHLFMPTANRNEAGKFAIENLEAGTYDIFGENDAAGYPNTYLSFYPNENPIQVTLGDVSTARVFLALGPKAGVLSGEVRGQTQRQNYRLTTRAPVYRQEIVKSRRFHRVPWPPEISLADTTRDRCHAGGDCRRLQTLALCLPT